MRVYIPEYHAKEILAQYGVTIPDGGVARTVAEAEDRARALKAERFAVKAQILAGGRGAAGGVVMAPTPSAVGEAAGRLLGSRLVTAQTDAEGEVVERIYVEAAIETAQSLYLAFVIDPTGARPMLLGSARGGVEFEAEAQADPSILETLHLAHDGAIDAAALGGFLERLGVPEAARAAVHALIAATVRAALRNDALFVEINPLVITPAHDAVAVDAKMILDDNALFRHPEFETTAREAVRDDYERIARENDLNFVRLEGNIGVVVNGAGLGLATNDMIADAGGRPANFMDIRTTATSFQIARGVELLLSDPGIKVLLVNVHGGGMTVCDTVAEALNFAYSRSDRRVPVVFRAAGQNADWARSIMRDRRLSHENATSMRAAVTRAVAIASGKGA